MNLDFGRHSPPKKDGLATALDEDPGLVRSEYCGGSMPVATLKLRGDCRKAFEELE
jgi:hypothetical protein